MKPDPDNFDMERCATFLVVDSRVSLGDRFDSKSPRGDKLLIPKEIQRFEFGLSPEVKLRIV